MFLQKPKGVCAASMGVGRGVRAVKDPWVLKISVKKLFS